MTEAWLPVFNYETDNIYWTKQGARQCRKCRRFLKKRWTEAYKRDVLARAKAPVT